MIDLPGIAIKEYYTQNSQSRLWVHDQFGPKVEMPVAVYFREFEDFTLLEKKAMTHCKGSILDIGAGAGAHTLYLQENNKDVTALEISPASVDVMTFRKIKKVVLGDFFELENVQYDTLLLLMNGIGICGAIDRIPIFLQKAKSLLKKGGKIIFDSSDIQYMYEDIPQPDHYYGEVGYQYSYKRMKTDWFTWLYIDFQTMEKIAEENGWSMQLLYQDENDQYLACLEPI